MGLSDIRMDSGVLQFLRYCQLILGDGRIYKSTFSFSLLFLLFSPFLPSLSFSLSACFAWIPQYQFYIQSGLLSPIVSISINKYFTSRSIRLYITGDTFVYFLFSASFSTPSMHSSMYIRNVSFNLAFIRILLYPYLLDLPIYCALPYI